jgi:hypothetical protein
MLKDCELGGESISCCMLAIERFTPTDFSNIKAIYSTFSADHLLYDVKNHPLI